MQYQGIVLAGSFLWDTFATALPRALLPIAGTPLACYTLCWLDMAGITRVTLCINSSTSLFRSSFGDGGSFNIDLDYYEDHTPRGPAGCAKDAAAGADADICVIVDGSLLPTMELQPILEEHVASGAGMTIVVHSEKAVKDGETEFLSPCGLYVVNRECLNQVALIGYQDIKETLIPRLHKQGIRTRAHRLSQRPMCVKSLGSYLEADRRVVATIANRDQPPQGYVKREDAIVHHSASVDSSALLLGPVLVGPRALVQSKALLLGPLSMGSDCIIGNESVVSRSILWGSVEIGASARVDRSVLGDYHAILPHGIIRNVFDASGTRDSLRSGLTAHRQTNLNPRATAL